MANSCERIATIFATLGNPDEASKLVIEAKHKELFPNIALSGFMLTDHFDNGTSKGGSRGSGSTCAHAKKNDGTGCIVRVSGSRGDAVYALNTGANVARVAGVNVAPAPAPESPEVTAIRATFDAKRDAAIAAFEASRDVEMLEAKLAEAKAKIEAAAKLAA